MRSKVTERALDFVSFAIEMEELVKSEQEKQDWYKFIEERKDMIEFLARFMARGQALDEREKTIASDNLLLLYTRPIEGNFNLTHLKKIHCFIFGNFLPEAGTIRNSNYLEAEMAQIHQQLKSESYLQGLSQAQFAKRLAYCMGEMKALHPFRTGNEIALHEYFRELALNAGYSLNFSHISKEQLLEAENLALNGSYEALKNLIAYCLTKEHEYKQDFIAKYKILRATIAEQYGGRKTE